MNDIRLELSGLPFWERLTEREREYLAENTAVRHYDKGSTVHERGSACLGLVRVLSGRIRAYILSEEGREVTLFLLEKGDFCVLTASCVISQITFDTHITAERDCELLVISAGALGRVAERNIYAKCFLYELATERFSAVMWSMQQLLFARFDRRLAGFLISEYERTGRNELRMTHEYIAGRVSSAREVVARMLKRFAAEGLVEVRRGVTRLTDIDGLRRLI